MEFQVNGLSRDLFSWATALRAAGQTGLSRELDRGLRDAALVVAREVESDNRDVYFPSAYAREFDSDLEVKPQVRAVSGHRISVVAVGKSGPKARDVQALNAGNLRHPVFGRYRVQRRRNAVTKKVGGKQLTIAAASAYKNPWVLQHVQAGWFSDPFERARPAALKQIQAAWDRVATKVNER